MKILAAFNDQSTAESVASLFLDLGWPRPTVVENSDEAIRRIDAEGGCDLLVTDVYLSPAGGFALRETLQVRLPEMRTIFVSDRDVSPYVNLLKGAPLLPYPLDAAALGQCLRALFPENSTPKPDSEDLVGTTLGKFDIREMLGERDGVEIYRAHQSNIGRQAMLFVPTREHSADPVRQAAFLEEAKAMARLSHNRVQAIYEAGEADGRCYFSCEFLGDSTLAKLVSNGKKISHSKALEIICLVADVCSYCEKRLVHLTPLTADAVLLPDNALPRLANLASSGQGEAPAAQMKALGKMILASIESSSASEPVRELALRLTNTDSNPLSWEEVETLATDAFPKARPAESRALAAKIAEPERKNRMPILIGAGAALAIVTAVGLSFFFLTEWSHTHVQDLGSLVEIPAGEFDFQGENTHLPTFFISKYEVSIAEYQKFLEDLERHPEKAAALAHPDQPAGKSHVPRGWADRTDIQPHIPGYYKRAARDGQYLGAPLTLDSPVFGVDWFDAYAYAKWCGRRLPTEQEWEKAARGRAKTRHPWGDGDSQEKANLGFDFTPSPDAKVGGDKDGFKRWSRVDLPASDCSDYGVYGMAGNVAEWTGSRADDKNPASNPVLRGASWMTGTDDPAETSTALRRATDWKSYQGSDTVGFRTASDKLE